MVLAGVAGKRRRFGMVVFLGIVTFGIYFLVWEYKAHQELVRQFELVQEGRKTGVLWFWLAFLLSPLRLLYLWIFVSNAQYVRERLALPRGVRPGTFLALLVAPNLADFAVSLWARGLFTSALSDAAFWHEFRILLVLLGATLAFSLAMNLVAFGRLQADLNHIWSALEHDRGQPPGAPAASGPPPAFGL
ncbi:MAG: DUF4234 domain-containing protein [Thermoplasmatota archaeon]